MDLEKLKFPIGKFTPLESYTKNDLDLFINDIESTPSQYRSETENLSDEQLDTQYRPEGWTLRQVIHHIPDSHMNALIRFKLALTEDNPTIRPYFEDRWAELSDYKMPVETSLNLIENIHSRWVNVLRRMNEKDFEKTLFHPEHNKTFTLSQMLHNYAWHSKHHLAHITELKKSKGWK